MELTKRVISTFLSKWRLSEEMGNKTFWRFSRLANDNSIFNFQFLTDKSILAWVYIYLKTFVKKRIPVIPHGIQFWNWRSLRCLVYSDHSVDPQVRLRISFYAIVLGRPDVSMRICDSVLVMHIRWCILLS